MALWNGRFGADADKSVALFTESISYDQRLWPYDIMGSKAHVTMLAEQKIIPAKSANAIKRSLDKIAKRIEKGDFSFKTELEDIHMHIETALIAALGDEGARVHSGRSRNDQIALDIRLYLREEGRAILQEIKEFQKTLLSVAEKNVKTILPGFTHLQHAQVVLLAHHLLAYVEMLDRDAGRLADCIKRFNLLPLGSGALAGSTLPLNRERVAELLGFDGVSRNSMDSVADRDFAIEFAAALATFGIHCSRISEDLVLWCSQEFAFVSLSDAFTTGSSLMPQKKNPDIAELTRGKSARLVGALTSLLVLCKGLPLTYNRDLQEDKEPVFDAIDTVKLILSVYPAMLRTMKVNAARMADAASDPALMATDLAEMLVRKGVPFRTAHHEVGAFVRWCEVHKKALNKTTLKEMKVSIPQADAAFLKAFDPIRSVSLREITGGTGFKAVASQIRFWKKRLAK